ncbi:hypothetical protein [Hymenobacter glaciei]|uniref:hypothetical protein n=1 Tax=Hymenobacter glaciei TaxID=877209 RepID=UPI0031EEEFC2
MNLLSFFHLVGLLVSPTPTAAPRKTSFAKVEILYTTSAPQRYVAFQLEAYIGDKWVLIDNDVTCKELQSSIIISCSPVAVQRERVLAFSLKDCELLYAHSFQDYTKLLIRLKTLTYHTTKKGYYVDSPRYFTPLWIRK